MGGFRLVRFAAIGNTSGCSPGDRAWPVVVGQVRGSRVEITDLVGDLPKRDRINHYSTVGFASLGGPIVTRFTLPFLPPGENSRKRSLTSAAQMPTVSSMRAF